MMRGTGCTIEDRYGQEIQLEEEENQVRWSIKSLISITHK
jgi:hypothetical protein